MTVKDDAVSAYLLRRDAEIPEKLSRRKAMFDELVVRLTGRDWFPNSEWVDTDYRENGDSTCLQLHPVGEDDVVLVAVSNPVWPEPFLFVHSRPLDEFNPEMGYLASSPADVGSALMP